VTGELPEEPAAAAAVRIEGLRKSFGTNLVLDGIDLSVASHEVICLIGASGSGKSTLLRCINLLEPIDAGRILLWGQDVTQPGIDQNWVRRNGGRMERLVGADANRIVASVWPDVRTALGLNGRTPPPPWRVVKERRATVTASATQERRRPAARTELANLVLAGDWTATGLPGTIEGAIRSGETAAGLCAG